MSIINKSAIPPTIPADGNNTTINADRVTGLETPVSDQDAANKAYVDAAHSSPGGNDTEVQYNDSGSFVGSSSMTYTAGTKTLEVNTINATTSLSCDLDITATGDVSAASLTLTKGAVTQITSILTTVVLNSRNGIVTTVSATTSASSTSIFSVTNSTVSATSIVLVNIVGYGGLYDINGNPVAQVHNISAGSFDIVIMNVDGAAALSGVIEIGFVVL